MTSIFSAATNRIKWLNTDGSDEWSAVHVVYSSGTVRVIIGPEGAQEVGTWSGGWCAGRGDAGAEGAERGIFSKHFLEILC